MAYDFDQKTLKELMDYDPHTGDFTWRVRRGGYVVPGAIAGNKHHSGYIHIQVFGKCYNAHRLAWLYVYGEWPDDEIDHVNGNPSDNRILNLRSVSHHENAQNRKLASHNTSGRTGVAWRKDTNKWRAYISINGQRVQLGSFTNIEDAHNAYLNAKQVFHKSQPTPREMLVLHASEE